jgi:predicted RNA-binding Zn ribbon-like protein
VLFSVSIGPRTDFHSGGRITQGTRFSRSRRPTLRSINIVLALYRCRRYSYGCSMVSSTEDPAGPLKVVLEFLNTVDLRTYGATRALLDRDQLTDPTSTRRWLQTSGLAVRRTPDADAVRNLRELRDKLRDALAGTRPFSFHPSVRLQFEAGTPPLIEPHDASDSPIEAMEATLVRASLLPGWSRVRICGAPDCQRAFYDSSRNGRSRWCSMRTCGNRMKTRSYRQRTQAGRASRAGMASPRSEPRPRARRRNTFRLEGEYWSISANSRTFRLKDSKGLRNLARLIAEPNREFHVLDLAGATRDPSLSASSAATAHDVLDPEARRRYKARIEELNEVIAEAERWDDKGPLATAREELQFLALELERSVGLGGRSRSFTSDAERARVSVTRVIKAALTRIADQSPELKHHFASAIRTGTYCSYNPDPRLPIRWEL